MEKHSLKVLAGENLNLLQFRGYASMDQLSGISLADEFDQELNPQGTQRDLNGPHARQIAQYAQSVTAGDDRPGAFPEVLLNVRKPAVISEITRSGAKVELHEVRPGDLVEIVVDLEAARRLNKLHDPAISRVDGNHRLAAPATLEGEDLTWPSIPFALFIGLTKGQERALFAAINGNQRKMNTSHLSNIQAALGGDALLLSTKDMPLWFATKLSEEGYAFHDRVYFGGAKDGVKERLGFIPPITLKQLQSATKNSLDELGGFLNDWMSAQHEAQQGSEESGEELVVQAQKVLEILNRFWLAVSRAYPEAWAENSGKKKYILFESIGLTAFSRFCGTAIIELMDAGYSQENFDTQLEQLASGFPLNKENFDGIAGGAGASRVFNELLRARTDENSKAKWAINNL